MYGTRDALSAHSFKNIIHNLMIKYTKNLQLKITADATTGTVTVIANAAASAAADMAFLFRAYII